MKIFYCIFGGLGGEGPQEKIAILGGIFEKFLHVGAGLGRSLQENSRISGVFLEKILVHVWGGVLTEPFANKMSTQSINKIVIKMYFTL